MSTDVLAPERYDQLLIDVKHDLRNSYASVGLETEVAGLQGWKAQLETDGSFGRILNGPQWIDRVAIRDGAVNADKVVAQFIIANEFTTAKSPADRVSLSTAGIQVYGTISSTPNQKVVDFQTSGSFALGDPGGNRITFDIGTGVLEVPAAVIPDLTISDVAAGIVGGNYDSASANPKIRFSTAGIEAWNSGGTKTFDLKTSDGSIAITGTFTVKSSVSGSRVEILNTGTYWYNSGGLRAKILSDGSGFLGSTNGLVSGASISWLTNGSTIINASAITAGDLNADRIFGGTLTVGDITISGTISMANVGGGTLGGGFNIGAQVISLNSSGRIQDADGSYWDQTGIVLKSVGSFGDAIRWNVAGSDKGSIYASSSLFTMRYASGGGVLDLDASNARIKGSASGSGQIVSIAGGGAQISIGSISSSKSFTMFNTTQPMLNMKGDRSDYRFTLGGTGGGEAVYIEGSSGGAVFGVASNGAILTNQTTANTNTPSGATARKFAIYNQSGSFQGYIPVYGSAW